MVVGLTTVARDGPTDLEPGSMASGVVGLATVASDSPGLGLESTASVVGELASEASDGQKVWIARVN